MTQKLVNGKIVSTSSKNDAKVMTGGIRGATGLGKNPVAGEKLSWSAASAVGGKRGLKKKD